MYLRVIITALWAYIMRARARLAYNLNARIRVTQGKNMFPWMEGKELCMFIVWDETCCSFSVLEMKSLFGFWWLWQNYKPRVQLQWCVIFECTCKVMNKSATWDTWSTAAQQESIQPLSWAVQFVFVTASEHHAQLMKVLPSSSVTVPIMQQNQRSLCSSRCSDNTLHHVH